MEKWQEVTGFLSYMDGHGFFSYIVGGAVRDYLLKRDVHDFDVTTNASDKQITELFPNAIKPSSFFPMFIIRWHSVLLDVSPYRAGSLKEDLVRRDFTINALAMDRWRHIIDPLGGQEDLKRKRIRSIKPTIRFKEDPLRILRMLRFSSELQFSIDGETWNTALHLKSLLQEVAVERIRTEIEKLLLGSGHDQALQLLLSGSYPSSFPASIRSFVRFNDDHWKMDDLKSSTERWSAFLWRMYGDDAIHSVSSWRFPKKTQRKFHFILRLLKEHPNNIPWDPYLIYLTGIQTTREAERVHQWVYQYKSNRRLEEVSDIYERLPIKIRGDLEVNGKDLVMCFPGMERKEIGSWLVQLEKAVVGGSLSNEKSELLTFIKEKRLDER